MLILKPTQDHRNKVRIATVLLATTGVAAQMQINKQNQHQFTAPAPTTIARSEATGQIAPPKSFQLYYFQYGRRFYKLRSPVECTVSHEENLWIYRCDRYGLLAYAETLDGAFQQLQEEFAFLYDGLVYETDKPLTLDAIELRDLLRSDVTEVHNLA